MHATRATLDLVISVQHLAMDTDLPLQQKFSPWTCCRPQAGSSQECPLESQLELCPQGTIGGRAGQSRPLHAHITPKPLPAADLTQPECGAGGWRCPQACACSFTAPACRWHGATRAAAASATAGTPHANCAADKMPHGALKPVCRGHVTRPTTPCHGSVQQSLVQHLNATARS